MNEGREQSARRRLPNRRLAVRFPVEHDGQNYLATIGYDAAGRPSEIFIDAAKPNSALAVHANDAAILASLLLQHGVTAEDIRHSLSGPIARALAELDAAT